MSAYHAGNDAIDFHPMGKNVQNRHTTVAFFMRSVPILTPKTTILKIVYDSIIRQS